ncbi:hypothetical protein ALC56_14425, partial [Trachymyrmex septentrionalis]
NEYLTKSAAISLYTELQYAPSRTAVQTVLHSIHRSACTGTTAEQHLRSHSSPLSCLSTSTSTYTITVSPPPLLLPPPPSPFTTTTATTTRHLHLYESVQSVGRHEPRVLGLLVFIRS